MMGILIFLLRYAVIIQDAYFYNGLIRYNSSDVTSSNRCYLYCSWLYLGKDDAASAE